MKVSIFSIAGARDMEPRLNIYFPNGDKITANLDRESVRDAVFHVTEEKYAVSWKEANDSVKAAIRDSKYTIPADTLEWANEK
jgi:hypothetical protein